MVTKHERRSDIKIKHCFFRSKESKCCSPEIDRFVPEISTGDDCPFGSELMAFLSEGKLRCPEFRHVKGVAEEGERHQT